MVQKSLDEIIEFIAEIYHSTPQQVRAEIQSVIKRHNRQPGPGNVGIPFPEKVPNSH